ncbi:hypothetical protein [Microbacterium sp. E-13]|uniref:hypothetical protein n=1 Tax=Microbacterium sp. E-13 TaxID=3404048 RepID=UPI003CEAE416
MGLQQRLVEMLCESFAVERAGADELILQRDWDTNRAPVRLVASEASLADYAAKNATDGLAALGEVGDDPTGALAALALLSVHIEETLAVPQGEAVTVLRVGSGGLDIQRVP